MLFHYSADYKSGIQTKAFLVVHVNAMAQRKVLFVSSGSHQNVTLVYYYILFGMERVCDTVWIDGFQDIIQLHISCPSDKEEEKSSKDEYENEEKEKKDKAPRKMLSRGKMYLLSFSVILEPF